MVFWLEIVGLWLGMEVWSGSFFEILGFCGFREGDDYLKVVYNTQTHPGGFVSPAAG